MPWRRHSRPFHPEAGTCVLAAAASAAGRPTPAVRNVLVGVAGNGPPTTDLDRVVDDYINHGFETFGFFKSGLNPDHVLPTAMRTQHAVTWRDDIRDIAGEIVDVVVMGAEDRRTFISYLRRDGSGVAEHLADILTELRFDVFLDRFRIPPGADFIERISDELIDKAMVVVVETAGAVGLRSTMSNHEQQNYSGANGGATRHGCRDVVYG
jgi:hypothetical protein